MSVRVFSRVPVLLVVLMVVMAIGAAFATAAKNPETAKRGPDQDAGHFLGHPTPTYSWHGCTKTSTYKSPTSTPPGMPAVEKGSSQKRVSWDIVSTGATASGWIINWEIKKGYKICGVQAMVRGRNDDVDTDLIMSAGYTSGGKKGSTVTSGSESIKVKISKNEAKYGGLPKKFGGKKYKIMSVYSLAVFIKKK